jgi:hypothetical protein
VAEDQTIQMDGGCAGRCLACLALTGLTLNPSAATEGAPADHPGLVSSKLADFRREHLERAECLAWQS